VDHATGRVAIEGDDARAVDRLRRALSREGDAPLPMSLQILPGGEPVEAHVARVREVLRFIAQGDVYQVNLARRIALRARGMPLDAFASMVKGAPSPYGFFLHFGDVAVCGTSPELALEARGDVLRTAPIKGTLPRGADARADGDRARALDRDPKERAELTMAIDLHRNDLGRVALPGSVRVRTTPRVVPGRAVFSRVAEVVARRAAGMTNDDVARAMVPCGSVTGAPKVRAMEIIADLEPFRRGLYTGTYGYVGRDGALVLAMAIRTLEIDVDEGCARYLTGGGIVADSDPWRELDETRWKAAQLERLLRPIRSKVGRIEEVALALE
jgi:anthranilate/para-aminobenzoate synthase component I